MKKIKFIHFTHLRNEAHYEFFWIFCHLLDEFPFVKTLIAIFYEAFIALLALEKKLLDAARASALTQQIADADHRVDRAVSGINAAVNAARHALDPKVAEAARVLYIRLREFGNIKGKAYEEESAAVQVLLHDFATTLAPQVTLVGLEGWVTELTEAETAFTQLYLQRSDEMSIRPQERMVDVRHDIEATYRNMTTIIEASAITAATPDAYNEFINKLNVQITYFNEHSHHHVRKDLGAGDHTVVEPIDTQAFTGKAITPLPKAFYREKDKQDVELVFAKDFSVTYKNNVEAGTAEVTLHGKGSYKGHKTVTFNIN